MDDFDNAESLAAQFHDRLSGMGHDGGNAGRGGGGRGGKRGARRGGRSGGGGGGSASSRSVDVSRALSRLLRHQAANAGVPLDPEGYAPLDQVLQWGPLRSMKVTVAEIRDVVATNDKQRFALRSADGHHNDSDDPAAYSIRANQGHSIATVTSDAGLLTPIDDPDTAPPVVCHGTFFAFWPAIEASGGLRRMTRNHVHCGCLEAEPTDAAASNQPVIPGLRRDAQLRIFLDVRRALREDPSLKWWRAANGVVLTEGDADGVVPTRFFKRVVTSKEGARLLPAAVVSALPANSHEFVLWDDGQKVADLPAETLAKARVPQGKQGLARRAAATETTQGKQNNGERARDEAASVRTKKRDQDRAASRATATEAGDSAGDAPES